MSVPSQTDRLRALESTGLLDTLPEPGFDRLTRLAAKLLEVPAALVSLVDDRRQFFKSAIGLGEPWASRRETPLSHSFCQYVARDRSPLVIQDARLHPVLRDNLAVRDLDVIAYAGIPLMVDDQAIGAFCVVDSQPRQWTPEQVQLLEDLAASVVSEIELRMALREARSARALTDAIVESIGDACIAIDPQRRFVVANHAARRILAGAEPGKIVPPGWAAMHQSRKVDGSPMLSEEGPLGRGLRGLPTDDLTFTLQRPGADAEIWVDVCGRPVLDAGGGVVGAVAVYRDVTEKRRQVSQLQRSDQIHRAIIQHLPNGAVFVVDRQLQYISAEGPILSEMMRRTELDGLVGKRVADVVSPGNLEVVTDRFRRALAGEHSLVEIERDGRYFDVSVVPIYDGGQITHALMASYDVTDRRRESREIQDTRDSLARERVLFESTLAHIEDGVALIDKTTRILLANRAFAAMLGLTPENVIGLTREGFIQQASWMLERPEGFGAALADQAQDAGQEFVFVRPRRRTLTRRWTRVPLADGDGILVTWHDVTAERDLLREREQQLLVDALTGIGNRRAGEAAMRTEHSRMKRTGTALCLALFDIDHFKQVNDVHGHATGDEVLRVVATSLAREARLTDTMVRWGGEEFLAVLNVPLDGARIFCERARASIEKLRCPPLERVTISAGIAQVAPDETLSDALARADRCLYEAKRAGRNRVGS